MLLVLLHALAVETSAPPPASAVPMHGVMGNREVGAEIGVGRAEALTQTQASVHAGWFFAHELEMSLFGGVQFANAGAGPVVDFTLLAEPSVHLPLGRHVDGFAGLGGGLGFSKDGVGVALEQRVGADVVLGPAATLTPALAVLYATERPQTASLGATLGYAVTW